MDTPKPDTCPHCNAQGEIKDVQVSWPRNYYKRVVGTTWTCPQGHTWTTTTTD